MQELSVMRQFNSIHELQFMTVVLHLHKKAAPLMLEQDYNAQHDKAHPFTSAHFHLTIPSNSVLYKFALSLKVLTVLLHFCRCLQSQRSTSVLVRAEGKRLSGLRRA